MHFLVKTISMQTVWWTVSIIPTPTPSHIQNLPSQILNTINCWFNPFFCVGGQKFWRHPFPTRKCNRINWQNTSEACTGNAWSQLESSCLNRSPRALESVEHPKKKVTTMMGKMNRSPIGRLLRIGVSRVRLQVGKATSCLVKTKPEWQLPLQHFRFNYLHNVLHHWPERLTRQWSAKAENAFFWRSGARLLETMRNYFRPCTHLPSSYI